MLAYVLGIFWEMPMQIIFCLIWKLEKQNIEETAKAGKKSSY
jgi:hypothetical protein